MAVVEVDLYKNIYLQAKNPICVLSSEGKILQVNPAHENLFSPANCLLVGDSFSGCINTDQLSTMLDAINNGEEFHCQAEFTKLNGKILHVDISASGIRSNTGKISAIIVISRDQTQRRASDNQLMRFHSMVNQSNDAFFIIDANSGQILDANLKASKRWGYTREEILQLTVVDLNPTYKKIDDWRQRIGHLQKNMTSIFETVHRAASGETFPVEISDQYVKNEEGDYIIAVIRDISERKAAEEKLRQAQRMESLGTLAGGIAHDFNNILSSIMGYAQLTQSHIPQNSEAMDSLAQIIIGGQRAAELVKQISTLGRKTEYNMASVEVQKIITETLKLLRPSLPTTIEIISDIDQDCPPIFADAVQIHQVIMNLCTNAYHAMRKQKSGVLEISLKRLDVQADKVIPQLNLQSGDYLQLQISDNGLGMDKTTLEKIFEPYFTTKKIGEGTGLGLAVAHGIIQDFGGYISVYSEPGKGSCFKVYLPLPNSLPVAEEKRTSAKSPMGTERLLVVDDEEALSNLIKAMLERYGYQVTNTIASPEALQLFKQTPELFDLVITDYAMPNMDGIDLATELLRVRPELPVLLCTGFNDKEKTEQALQAGIKACINKPMQAEELALMVRQTLDQIDPSS